MDPTTRPLNRPQRELLQSDRAKSYFQSANELYNHFYVDTRDVIQELSGGFGRKSEEAVESVIRSTIKRLGFDSSYPQDFGRQQEAALQAYVEGEIRAFVPKLNKMVHELLFGSMADYFKNKLLGGILGPKYRSYAEVTMSELADKLQRLLSAKRLEEIIEEGIKRNELKPTFPETRGEREIHIFRAYLTPCVKRAAFDKLKAIDKEMNPRPPRPSPPPPVDPEIAKQAQRRRILEHKAKIDECLGFMRTQKPLRTLRAGILSAWVELTLEIGEYPSYDVLAPKLDRENNVTLRVTVMKGREDLCAHLGREIYYYIFPE